MDNHHLDYQAIIDKYYPEDNLLRRILTVHSRQVADRALSIVDRHPELEADRQFVEEAAMLHDIGIVRTDAPGIECHGTEPYIRHGIIGEQMLTDEGLPRHAHVCAHHTGAGISLKEIEEQQLPLPHRDFLPETVEEEIICYADKFYSKSNMNRIKTVEQAAHSLEKFGSEGVKRFLEWAQKFELT